MIYETGNIKMIWRALCSLHFHQIWRKNWQKSRDYFTTWKFWFSDNGICWFIYVIEENFIAWVPNITYGSSNYQDTRELVSVDDRILILLLISPDLRMSIFLYFYKENYDIRGFIPTWHSGMLWKFLYRDIKLLAYLHDLKRKIFFPWHGCKYLNNLVIPELDYISTMMKRQVGESKWKRFCLRPY